MLKRRTPRRVQNQTPEEAAHIARIHEMLCVVCDSDHRVTAHHCHGGSMLDIPGFINPGWSQKSSDWLTIPLHWHYHTGGMGIDSGAYRLNVDEWETMFGTQVHHLDTVCRLLGYNVWKLAGINREILE